jgi:AcrR family transcriptional regulator
MQRARLLGAAVVVVDELGWAGASVAHISARARVSRRTFYDLFADREDCLIALLDDVVERVVADLDSAGLGALPWRERVRVGLWRVLCFFDREPAVARVCVVQSARGGRRVLERREQILTRIARLIDEGRYERPRAADCPVLTAEGLVGAGMAILYSRLLRGERDPLSGLLGELMGLIVLPYLGAPAARQERARALPSPASKGASQRTSHDADLGGDLLRDLPMRLTYRTARVLEVLAAHPGASNRIVAEHAEITDQGQVSKLLARLERLGLSQNTGQGPSKGEPNEWTLTLLGHEVTHTITSPHTVTSPPREGPGREQASPQPSQNYTPSKRERS